MNKFFLCTRRQIKFLPCYKKGISSTFVPIAILSKFSIVKLLERLHIDMESKKGEIPTNESRELSASNRNCRKPVREAKDNSYAFGNRKLTDVRLIYEVATLGLISGKGCNSYPVGLLSLTSVDRQLTKPCKIKNERKRHGIFTISKNEGQAQSNWWRCRKFSKHMSYTTLISNIKLLFNLGFGNESKTA